MAEPDPKDATFKSSRLGAELTQPGELPHSSSIFGPTGFGPVEPGARPPLGTGSAFDVCHVGVVLRALLFVHVTLAVGVSFAAGDLKGWLTLVAMGASMALPAVLLWLVAACLLKRALAPLPPLGQWVVAIALGALSGGFGWGLQAAGGLSVLGGGVPWVAPVLSGAALAAALFYWLTLRARARLPADTTARLAELQSRIRPHFLFNTLNTAITLARLDPARTEGLLEDLAELFRVALTDTGESVSLADEVTLAKRYLAIEQIRFGERLQVSWELDDDAGAARVPPLLLQPLVENAVRHGVEPAADGGVIRIRTRVKRAHAVVSIVNTLPKQPSRPGNGMALRNVRERLRLMHDVAAQFEIHQERDFFRVQIVVPL
ncbi:MAG TPA: histidine kinase [Rhizobacter sp.]|jgi:two-component system sensor histidine kinase AlgZ|nr:histidine kinase [Rhizobacter sp.]